MKKIPLFTFLWLICILTAHSRHVFGHLNFAQGQWALVGVPLHNYKALPVQKELGTFITKDATFMQQIQQDWDLEMTFEDKCDYHYALKFYLDGKLVETAKLNLYCGYLTVDGFSYTFDPQEFERFKQHANPIHWSRISFADLHLLKKAIQKLDTTEDVYWYEDVQQYQYPGYFMFGINALPWSADLDSLYQAVTAQIRIQTHSSDFYLQKYYHLIRGDYLYVRYILNCEPSLAGQLDFKQTLGWRSHLAGKDSVRIVAIGIDEQRYWELMRQ
ncbi:MAG: hypothetical protein D6730_24220 [Bacteroidetes bacterium]|nr:MAG: hypothetical protein D6730_24220 [Bacteroidota bacterium]